MRKRTAILFCAVLGAWMMLALTACGAVSNKDTPVSLEDAKQPISRRQAEIRETKTRRIE